MLCLRRTEIRKARHDGRASRNAWPEGLSCRCEIRAVVLRTTEGCHVGIGAFRQEGRLIDVSTSTALSSIVTSASARGRQWSRRGSRRPGAAALQGAIAAFQQPGGLTRHVGLLEVIDELRRLFAFRLAGGLQDMRLRDTAEIVVDRRRPARFDHAEADRSGKLLRMGDFLRTRVPCLDSGVQRQRDAMGKQRHTARLIVGDQIVPEHVGIAGKIMAPGLLPLTVSLAQTASPSICVWLKGSALRRGLQARVGPVSVEGFPDEHVQGGDKSHHRIIGKRISERDSAGGS